MDQSLDKKIARNGFLYVNLPIILIMLGSWIVIINFDLLSFRTAGLAAGAIGWLYWEFAIIKWIKWSLSQGVDEKRLFVIGKRNLLLWSAFKITDVLKKTKK